MSELEQLKTMLTLAEIIFTEKLSNEGHIYLQVERGHTGFYTEFVFTADGILKDMGSYEA